MMRIVLAAYALCAALVLMIGVGGTAPAEAGYYRYGYHGGGYDRGYRGYGIRTGYYGSRSYYGRRAYYGGRGYYRGYDSGYRTTYYDRPAYRSGYVDSDYYDSGYTSGGYNGCHTTYLPYGWRWYRASSC